MQPAVLFCYVEYSRILGILRKRHGDLLVGGIVVSVLCPFEECKTVISFGCEHIGRIACQIQQCILHRERIVKLRRFPFCGICDLSQTFCVDRNGKAVCFRQVDAGAFTDDRTVNQIMVKSATISTVVSTDEATIPVTNHRASIMMTGGAAGHVTVNVFGGKGYSAKVIWLVNGTETLYSKEIIYNVSEGGFDFVAPVNDTNDPQTYAIRITHLDNDAVEDTIEVTVPVAGEGSGEDPFKISVNVNLPTDPTGAAETTESTLPPPPAP